MNYLKQRLKDIFSTTYEKGIQWEGNSLSDIDYYSLSCKAAANDILYNFKESNVCMFKCNYENEEAILIIFSIPINLSKESKHITERVMNTIQLLEETFVYVDYLSSVEQKEEKFVYLTVIKKVT